jgi:hypothetical protein
LRPPSSRSRFWALCSSLFPARRRRRSAIQAATGNGPGFKRIGGGRLGGAGVSRPAPGRRRESNTLAHGARLRNPRSWRAFSSSTRLHDSISRSTGAGAQSAFLPSNGAPTLQGGPRVGGGRRLQRLSVSASCRNAVPRRRRCAAAHIATPTAIRNQLGTSIIAGKPFPFRPSGRSCASRRSRTAEFLTVFSFSLSDSRGEKFTRVAFPHIAPDVSRSQSERSRAGISPFFVDWGRSAHGQRELARLNLKTAVGRSEVLAVCDFSRLGCISLARGGAARGGGGH